MNKYRKQFEKENKMIINNINKNYSKCDKILFIYNNYYLRYLENRLKKAEKLLKKDNK